MAESAQPEGGNDVGPVSQTVETVSIASSSSLSFGLPYVAKPHSEEPDTVVLYVRFCGESKVMGITMGDLLRHLLETAGNR